METKELIEYLKEDNDLRHPYDRRMRKEIIKRLKEYEGFVEVGKKVFKSLRMRRCYED